MFNIQDQSAAVGMYVDRQPIPLTGCPEGIVATQLAPALTHGTSEQYMSRIEKVRTGSGRFRFISRQMRDRRNGERRCWSCVAVLSIRGIPIKEKTRDQCNGKLSCPLISWQPRSAARPTTIRIGLNFSLPFFPFVPFSPSCTIWQPGSQSMRTELEWAGGGVQKRRR